MLLGLVLLFVGAVLFLNGIWVMGHIEDGDISVINIFVGTLTLLVALYLAFGPEAARFPSRTRRLRCCSPSPITGWRGTVGMVRTGGVWAGSASL